MGRDGYYASRPRRVAISIHSPCMGRDAAGVCQHLGPKDFNPLSLHGERRTVNSTNTAFSEFQSTLPAWGETFLPSNTTIADGFQSTLPAWGETAWSHWQKRYGKFQSTLPAWGETALYAGEDAEENISIHSPCMGRDTTSTRCAAPSANFNPLSLHGERHVATDLARSKD